MERWNLPNHGGLSQGGRGTEHRAAWCCARYVCWGVPVSSAPAAVVRAVSERLSFPRGSTKLIVMTPTRYFRLEIPSPPCHASGHCRCNCRHMVCAGEGTTSMVAPTDADDEPILLLPNPVRLCPSENFGQERPPLTLHTALLALLSYRPPPLLSPS